jgi:hypothetical protein
MHTNNSYDAYRDNAAGVAEMSKFKSHEEYDHWRSQRALKRQGARDLEKLDAERPVYMGGVKHRVLDLWGFAVPADFALACIVFMFSVPGREFLGTIVEWFGL